MYTSKLWNTSNRRRNEGRGDRRGEGNTIVAAKKKGAEVPRAMVTTATCMHAKCREGDGHASGADNVGHEGGAEGHGNVGRAGHHF